MTDKQEQYKTPDCFESAPQWREYQRMWRLSKGMGRVNYCTDCTPEYRDAMIKEWRCAHPQTIFVEKDGELIGLNGSQWGSWAAAISGKGGNIISAPDPYARDAFIVETYRKHNGQKYYTLEAHEQPDTEDA